MDTFIEELLSSTKNVIFSKPNCVECVKVKDLLNSSNDVYKIININDSEFEDMTEALGIDKIDLMDKIKENTGAKTYPICFRDTKFVENDQFKKLIQISFKMEELEDF
tara:strand:- start:140 stop:463 length:324 start_codon:yes stop_codon:yes gene_type:complete